MQFLAPNNAFEPRFYDLSDFPRMASENLLKLHFKVLVTKNGQTCGKKPILGKS